MEVGSEENECGSFNGLRFHMSDGRHGGYLYEDENGPIHTLGTFNLFSSPLFKTQDNPKTNTVDA